MTDTTTATDVDSPELSASVDGFEDLRAFHDPDLVLPIRGRKYRIPQPSALEGLRIRQLFAAGFIADTTELAEIMKILGAKWEPKIVEQPLFDPMTGDPELREDGTPATVEQDLGAWVGGLWDDMVAHDVTWEELLHAGRTALIDVGVGRFAARTHWATGLAPAMDIPGLGEEAEKAEAAVMLAEVEADLAAGRRGGAEGNVAAPNRAQRRAKPKPKGKKKRR